MGTAGRQWVRWNKRMRAAFLDHLAATCHITAAAEAAGVSIAAVYALRRRDAAFAADWREALAAGYEVLETRLVGHALAGGGERMTNGDDGQTGPIDTSLALRLLTDHRAAMTGKANKPGAPRHRATIEQTDASILKKLAAIEASMKRAL